MEDFPRLIEHGFPLRETSLAAVHEKNVRHGHISTLHIWPARRPLAACRAALIATLLPDPGDPKTRADIFKRLAGAILDGASSVKDIEGGILRWGSENDPDLQWFRDEIRKAYGGRAPRVLDPFAGGGAIPLEAMRLGCETTAIDINPVAWFVLKCTLEYPQRFAGLRHPLPSAVHTDDRSPRLEIGDGITGDLAAQVRTWGQWVLERARLDLAAYYPTVDGRATLAYLWARTVRCKNCRLTIPLLKTRWLCKTPNKAVALTIKPKADGSGVEFGVAELDKKQRAHYDASGTMNSSGVRCPCCPAQMTMAELRIEGTAQRMGTVMTAVVIDGPHGKMYRIPTTLERTIAEGAAHDVDAVYSELPFGVPEEYIPLGASRKTGGSAFTAVLYGLRQWKDIFSARQLVALGTFTRLTREAHQEMLRLGYPVAWAEAIASYLAIGINRIADYCSTVCSWHNGREQIGHTFARFALPIIWDFAESVPTADSSGGYAGAIDWIARVVATVSKIPPEDCAVSVKRHSAIDLQATNIDLIITDPPYYDAIPYSDLMDFFYVWLRRSLYGLSADIDAEFVAQNSPKWDRQRNDGELVDDAGRFNGDGAASHRAYEDGMFRAFQSAERALAFNGRFVIVFAHKDPDAWEALVSAIIRAGFTVDASWPIATEMSNRSRALGSAALASSIWLVCKKRDSKARPGWDSSVREDMRSNITERMREFWDAGIRGPDFVWAAIGPALEAFSMYPRVRRVESPDDVMTVSEFLADVRREVVGFAAARVLHRSDDTESDIDGPTTYYLLHRHDFKFQPVPVGASILYAVSCNLRDTTLIDEYDLLLRPGRSATITDAADHATQSESEAADELILDAAEPSLKTDKSLVQLKPWNERKRASLGEDAIGRPAPLIDQIHYLMRLWKLGDVTKVNDYIAARGLASDHRAREVIQAIIELAERASEERSILEAISNHLGDARATAEAMPALFT